VRFNHEMFYQKMREEFGGLKEKQVEGLNFLLNSIEADPHLTDVREPAYMLATTMHETANTFLPIHEYGKTSYFIQRYGGQTALGKRLGNDTPEEGATYAGRGDVQLTGEDNYEKAEEALRREYPDVVRRFEERTGRAFDLTAGDQPGDERDPDNAQDPEIAYCVMSYGMRTGMFTGKKMAHYFTAALTDYVNARRIINGTDKASLIAVYAQKFERILRTALVS
jgi:putative chitinase